jgi:hypothetical protein
MQGGGLRGCTHDVLQGIDLKRIAALGLEHLQPSRVLPQLVAIHGVCVCVCVLSLEPLTRFR